MPSTTPFAQAGILYGDNSEIPSFRWWDRERRLLVKFGARSTFRKVADKYFQGRDPLIQGGACIAACYPAGAADNFGIAYRERSYGAEDTSRSAFRKVADKYFQGRDPLIQGGACIAACYPAGAADNFGIAYRERSYGAEDTSRSAFSVLLPYLANPVHLGDWVWQTASVVARTVSDYAMARSKGRRPAPAYVMTDVAEEIFVHHLTRYAVQKAMREGYSPIYAGFYAYDETAHAFGPTDRASQNVLRHVDHTIHKIAALRAGSYEMVVLSDHGQVDTVPFPVGERLEKLMPGRLIVAASGGLAHVYVKDAARRLSFGEVTAQHPQLLAALRGMNEVALVMARDGEEDVLINNGPDLGTYDDADILQAQLRRLNSFAAAGDIILFGAFVNGAQVNFENQAGGHGSIGGEQLKPFVLARKDWGIDTSAVRGAHELHPMLRDLRDHLRTA